MGFKDAWKQAKSEVEAHDAAKRGEPPPGPQTPPPPPARPPQVEVRTYKDAKEYQQDAKRRVKDGWEVQAQSEKDQKTAIMRTAGKTVLTGGLGLVVMGRSKKGDTITVTWVKGQSTNR